MSKVTITLEVDRYICTELDEVRTMIDTKDFSGLSATVERIQKHANAMESAITNYNHYLSDIKHVISSTGTLGKKAKTNKEKIKAIEEILKKKYHNW